MKQQKRTKEEMYPLVEAYLDRRESVTVREFSSSHDISEGVFTYWLGKYRRHLAPADQFIDITPPVGSQDSQPLVELLYPNGIRLRMFVPVEPAYLRSLVSQGDLSR